MKASGPALVGLLSLGALHAAAAFAPPSLLGQWRPQDANKGEHIVSFSADLITVTERGVDHAVPYSVVSADPLILRMTPRDGGPSEDLAFSLKDGVLCLKKEGRLVDCLVRR